MKNDRRYACAVTPTDNMRAYVTQDAAVKGAPCELFALVLTNDRDQKVSVLLTATDAEALHAQLNDWCFGVAK